MEHRINEKYGQKFLLNENVRGGVANYFLLHEIVPRKGEAKSEKTISRTPRLLDSQEYLM